MPEAIKNLGFKKMYSLLCMQILFFMAFSQDNMLQEFQNQFGKHISGYEREKLFVHTDKTLYLTGETIWFKLYDVNAATNKPTDLSKVAYVEILNSDQKPVLQTKVSLKETTGDGSLLITSSILTGNYILRAYTNWMKNFDPEFYFQEVISIVNTLKGPDAKTNDTSGNYDIQFFPEGGNLVYGLESKMGFRVAGREGKGIASAGVIVNQNNDTVAGFHTFLFGLGHFLFTPQKNNQYKILVSMANGETIISQLPQIYDNGYVMDLSASDTNLKVSVNTNVLIEDQRVYVLVYNKRKVSLAFMKAIQDGKAEFVFSKNMLEDGISYITVFNSARQPLCERIYFKRPRLLHLDVKTDKKEFGTRQRADIKLTALDSAGLPANADLSATVYLVDSLQHPQISDISSYLWLTSELKGTIESPQYYLNHFGADADTAIEDLLLTHGWRKFNRDETSPNSKPAFQFIPEYSGNIITCRLIDKRTNSPAKGVVAYASVPGKQFKFSTSVSDENGLLHFEINNFFGVDNLVVQTRDSVYEIEPIDPFPKKYTVSQITPIEFLETLQKDLVSHIMSAQIQSAYTSGRPESFLMPVSDTTAFYGKADKTYFLDDYTRFTTMEEVMREYVTEVLVRKSEREFHFRVSNTPYKLFFETDPLVLIDGVPVFDINKIISFDPLKIKKMDIVTRKYYYGNMTYSGIVSYSTYNGDLGGFQLDPSALIVEYQGLQLQRQFYSPVYETKIQQENRLPDFRNVLLWSPQMRTDKNGQQELSFYTSDLPGSYIIFIQGITSEGLCGSTSTTFIVKK
jgi:hypothetical protein